MSDRPMTFETRPLSRPYTATLGAPTLIRVSTEIFSLIYFRECMSCGFCNDACCQFGVDVAVTEYAAILQHAAELQRYVTSPPERWFDGTWTLDAELPGGRYTRTAVVEGACAFRRRGGRGCGVHAYCLDAGIDYHALKPMVSALFPLTFEGGTLRAAEDVQESLVCAGLGSSLYDGVRRELQHYFGADLVAELDRLRIAPPP